MVWHGTYILGERAMETYCDAWNSPSSNKLGLASSLLRGKVLEQEKFACSNRYIVLCIEALSQPNIAKKKRDVENVSNLTMVFEDSGIID